MGMGSCVGNPPVDGDGVELILEVHEAVAPGVEQDALAVGRPASDVFVGGMVGKTAWHAAGGRDDVDVAIAVVLAGESDHGAVGGEVRQSFEADVGGEAVRVATVAADRPEIAGVVEDDLRLADGGKSQQERGIGLGECGMGEERDDGQGKHHREGLAHFLELQGMAGNSAGKS